MKVVALASIILGSIPGAMVACMDGADITILGTGTDGTIGDGEDIMGIMDMATVTLDIIIHGIILTTVIMAMGIMDITIPDMPIIEVDVDITIATPLRATLIQEVPYAADPMLQVVQLDIEARPLDLHPQQAEALGNILMDQPQEDRLA